MKIHYKIKLKKSCKCCFAANCMDVDSSLTGPSNPERSRGEIKENTLLIGWNKDPQHGSLQSSVLAVSTSVNIHTVNKHHFK